MRPEVRRYGICGATIASDVRLPQLRRATGGQVACTIASGDVEALMPAVWFHQWRLGRRPWLSIGRGPRGYGLRFHGLADFAVSGGGERITAAPAAHLPGDTLEHLLTDQVLPLALSRQGRLLLHASAVHLPFFGTVGFVGQTSRGKSTLAAALAARGGRIVSDDCLAIEFEDGVPYALPAYPGLRLWPGAGANALLGGAAAGRVAHYSRKRRVPRGSLPFHGRRSPLRALFLLSPRASSGPLVTLRRCRPAAALLGLVRFAYLLDVEDRRDLARVFEGVSTLAAQVEVRHLRLRDGHGRLPRAVDLIRAALTGPRVPGRG